MRALWAMVVALLVSLGLMGCATVDPLQAAREHCTIVMRVSDGQVVATTCPPGVP